MRILKYALPLVVFVLIAAKAGAAEDKVETWTGTLAEKAKDAKEGVAAALKVKDGDKEVSVNLWAEGAVAKDLKEMAAKGAKAKVTGTKVDATDVKVTKVEKVE
jgi:hypothetical protein